MEHVGDVIQEKTAQLCLMGDRLRLLQSHDALLLRHSFSIPKVLYILQTASCFLSPHIEAYDSRLRSLLSDITNVNLTIDSIWFQASLPVRAGGIGIRRAAQLAPSAFLASAAGCSEFIRQILSPRLQDAPNPSIETALTFWRHGHDEPPLSDTVSHQQKAWDPPRIRATYDALLDASHDQSTRARLLAVAAKESGAWLNALPVSSLGLRMENDVIRVVIGLRLGATLCEPHHCLHCHADVDSTGSHGLSCHYSKERHPRHAALNDLIKRALDTAKIPCHLEPTGLYRADGKRPDGVSIVPWKGGKVLVWNATCPDTLASSYSDLSSREVGAAAEEAERKKKAKYAHLEASHCFFPVATETLGVFGPEAHCFIRDLGRRIADTYHPGPSFCAPFEAENCSGSTVGEFCSHPGHLILL